MADIHGGRLVAKALKAEDVSYIFTLCGGHVMPIYDGCVSDIFAIEDQITALAPPERILYGSDWPFVLRSFVVEQQENLTRMAHFSGTRFAAMERDNARRMFKRFA